MVSAFISLTSAAGAVLINPEQIRGYAAVASAAAARLLGSARTPASLEGANAIVALIDVPTPFYVTQTYSQITTAIAAAITAADGAAVGANNTFTGDNTFSGNNTHSGRVTTSGTIIRGNETLTPAGTIQGDALLMTANIPFKLAAGSATAGIKLPAYNATTNPVGTVLIIANTSTVNTLRVFPNTSEEVDAAGSNVQVTVATTKVTTFTRVSSTKWSTNT